MNNPSAKLALLDKKIAELNRAIMHWEKVAQAERMAGFPAGSLPDRYKSFSDSHSAHDRDKKELGRLEGLRFAIESKLMKEIEEEFTSPSVSDSDKDHSQ